MGAGATLRIDYVYVTISFVSPTDKPFTFRPTSAGGGDGGGATVTRIVTGADGGTTIVSEAVQTELSIISVPDRLKSESGVDLGAVIGGAVGGLFLLCCLIALVVVLVRRSNQNTAYDDQALNNSNATPQSSARSTVTFAALLVCFRH
jgi:hypothetical protein